MQYTHVLYHKNCLDGFGAAYAAWKTFGDAAQYIPVAYGDAPPDLPADARVLIADFSYRRPVLEALRNRVACLQVLDHHKTAQADLEGLEYAHFNLHKSGAVLTWEHLNPTASYTPSLFLYIQDRDLWLWQMPHSLEVLAVISAYPYEFKFWDRLLWDRRLTLAHDLHEAGRMILLAKDTQIQANIENAYLSVVCAGVVIPVVNTNAHISETLNQICKQYSNYPYAAAYFDQPDGQRKWSLRSIGEYDVSTVCQVLGGGGHKNASGFLEKKPTTPLWMGSLA